jgi:hypothetical protein
VLRLDMYSTPSTPAALVLEPSRRGRVRRGCGQGEDTTAPRAISGHVQLSMVPNLMRALGYYPSEAEVADMLEELQAEGRGQEVRQPWCKLRQRVCCNRGTGWSLYSREHVSTSTSGAAVPNRISMGKP